MIIAVIFVLGLCIGSFTNALVWRIHEQQKPKKARRVPQKDLSIVKGRSMCPHCHHKLAWYDLLPVISWLQLRGRCRYCRAEISWQYPLVEIITAVVFAASYVYWPLSMSGLQIALFALWLLILGAFMALAIYDLRWMILPNRIIYPLQGVAAVFALITIMGSDHVLHSVLLLAYALIGSAGLFYGLHTISQGRWIGGGDVRLAFAIGLILASPSLVFLMLFIASLIGTLIAIPMMIAGKARQNTKLPFGPLLIVATIIVYLFGTAMIAWYNRQLLIV